MLLKLIRKYLQDGVMINGVGMDTEEGTPQGGSLNPLLRKLNSCSKPIPMEQRIEKLNPYLVGGCGYYALAKTQENSKNLMNGFDDDYGRVNGNK